MGYTTRIPENLQREDLNSMDQAKGILAFIQAKLPDKNYDVEGVMSELMWYMRKPEDVSEEVVATVATTLEIVGKSIKTLFNGISLLKLPPEIQVAIRGEIFPSLRVISLQRTSNAPIL